MKFRFYILSLFIFSCSAALAQPKIKLDTFSRSYPSPVDIINDGSTSRVFIVGQTGLIFVLDSNGTKLDTFLDIRSKVQTSSEEGLLGLAFHPQYATNGYFYTYYTKKGTTDNAVFRYKVSANPNRALKDSQFTIINFSHPTFTNHNGGCIKFGSDGFLYIGTGDGGFGGDPNNNAQNKNAVLGKILRIDVNHFDTAYIVPPSNPFYAQSNVKKEIWAYGLRNPWRFSFDRQTNDLWIGDVGQDNHEEIDFQYASSTGGENYGWRCYEGNNAFNTAGCSGIGNYKFPVFAYNHDAAGGDAVTGGYVYRGTKYNDLKGYYICADYASGNFWVIKKTDSVFTTTALGMPLPGANVSCFGQDIRGEFYAANVSNGVIYKIRELCSPFKLNLVTLADPSCPNVLNGSIQMSSTGSNGAVSYNWSPSNSGNTISNLGPGKYVVTATDAIGCARKDSFVLHNADTLKVSLTNLVNPSCPDVSNGLLNVTGIGGDTHYSYSWSNGDTTWESEDLGPGKYIVTVHDDMGCSAKDSFVLYNADTLDKPIVTQPGLGAYFQTDPGFSYQWKRSGIDIPGATHDTLNHNLVVGAYQVEITDINGCKAISDSAYIVLTAVKNKNTEIEKLSLYPNPAGDNLTVDIRFMTSKKSAIKISNSIGQIVYQTEIQGKDISKTISLKQLPKGMYELSVNTDDGKVQTMTFLKE